jgi:phosphatidylglycerol:prolipoprotein diacylglycerol transferase
VLASPGPIAFFLGPLPVRWYGLLVAAAIGLGFWLADRQARAARLPADRLLSTAQWAVVAGLVGARLYEVAFNWEYYGRHLDKIPAVWEGGLAIHGGLIAGSLVVVTLAMYGRLPVLRSLDVAAPSIALGQAIGRWGNFFNEEAFGSLPRCRGSSTCRPITGPPDTRSFLYESLWDLGVFLALVLWLRPKVQARAGALFFSYLGLYSVGRGLIETLRLDSFWLGDIRVAQFASAAGLVVAAAGLVWISVGKAGRRIDRPSWGTGVVTGDRWIGTVVSQIRQFRLEVAFTACVA